MKYQDIVDYLLNIPRFSKKTSPENLSEMLHRLGNPQESMKIVHVAGTNGKGSVCAFLNSMLMVTEKRVGMFTSPHLVKMNERIKISGQNVSDEMFMEAFQDIYTLTSDMQKEGYTHPSFFEYLFLMAVVIFHKQKVEYAIFEVGLGGRLDATNILKNPMVSVITSVSKDHTEILGETLEEIAGEKAGIIKEGVPVVYYHSDDTVADVIEDVAKERHTKAYALCNDEVKINEISSKKIDFSLDNRYYKCGNITVNFPAEYQAVNGSLAYIAFQILKQQDAGLAHITNPEAFMQNAKWEGRMEMVCDNIYFDGAHNPDGIKEFVKCVNRIPCEGRRILLFSVVMEKDYEHMISQLIQETGWDEIIIAQMDNYRAVSKEEILQVFQKYTEERVVHIEVYNHVKEALEAAVTKKQEKDVLFCAGSLYMIGELKGYLEVKND